MCQHFRLSSELTGAIAKRLPHAKNQLSAPGSFFNQFVTDIYIYTIYTNINRVLIVRICNELIEETAGRRKLIFGMWRYYAYGSSKFWDQSKMSTYHGIMTSLSHFLKLSNTVFRA